MSLAKAKAWAAAGWPVFPVAYGKPAISKWEQRATTNVDEFEWDEMEVACVPGLAGCWVLDVDIKEGKPGDKSLADISLEHSFETWDVPQQRTRSGGRHLFFRGTAATSTGTLAPGLDTRGGSAKGGLGFIFCHADRPPCAPGGCPDAPATLVSRIGQPRAKSEHIAEAPEGGWDLPVNVRRAERFLATVDPAIEGQAGDLHTFTVACKVRDLGVSPEKCRDLMLEHFNERCLPPWGEDDIVVKIDSAYRNGQLDAGNAAASGALERIAAEEWAKRPTGRQKLALWSERRNRAAPPWLWHELLPAGGLVGLYGQGGSYKTFLALRLAVAIANKEVALGGRALQAGPVVYIAGEGQQEPRLRALEAEYGPISDQLALFDGIDLTSPEDQAILRDDLAMAISDNWGGRAPVLVVIDTLARAAPGIDENSNRDMGQIVQTCDAMRKALGCAVLLVHHTPKGSDDWRGATAAFNALDAALLVKRRSDLKANLYARRIKDAADGGAWDIGLKTVGTSVAVSSLKERPVAHEASQDKGESRAAAQQRMRETAINETRAKVAIEILSGGHVISPRALTRQMCASLGDGADAESVRSWLRGVMRKGGGLNEAHPLAGHVATLAPLAFASPAA